MKGRKDAPTKQFAIKDITICPALILAISRTVSVKGRIKILTVSIKTKKGVKAAGAPAGARWATDSERLKLQPDKMSRPHIVRANEPANQRLLVAP